MHEHWLSRTEILIGHENIEKLKSTTVAIVGLGGVGSFACEAIARAGVGNLILIDYDRVACTNINRQIIATHSTIGKQKTEVMRQRIVDINPDAKIEIYAEFINKENRNEILKRANFIIDAIDSIGPKMGMIKDLCFLQKPFISILGAGNRIDPDSIKTSTIWQTSGCPLARRLKKLLRRNAVTDDFPVVYSTERPIHIETTRPPMHDTPHIPKTIVGSISYMPAIMGTTAAGKLINMIIDTKEVKICSL